MNAIEQLENYRWKRPENYAGHNPEGYVIYTCNRDSSIAEKVNYDCIKSDLGKLSEKLNRQDAVYSFRANHWGCGWIDTIIVSDNAPDEIKQVAGEIACALEDYPLYNEDKVSEAEHEAKQEYWERCSIKERVELIKEYSPECSIFAARRDWYGEDIDHDGGFLEFVVL